MIFDLVFGEKYKYKKRCLVLEKLGDYIKRFSIIWFKVKGLLFRKVFGECDIRFTYLVFKMVIFFLKFWFILKFMLLNCNLVCLNVFIGCKYLEVFVKKGSK